MEIRTLLSFQKICEYNSFSKAAALLGYSQSTLTMQIKQLENELEVQLFDRIGKSVRLSDDGRKFLTYVNDILMISDNAKQALKKDSTPSGELRIGILESVCTAHLPEILKQYHTKCPLISTIIKIGTFDELSAMLSANVIDILWTFDLPFDKKEWRKVYSYHNKICVIASPDNHLASIKNLTISALKEETFLFTEQNCSYRTVFESQMKNSGCSPNVFLEIGNTEIIKKFVAANLGISVLPQFTIQDEILNEKIICLQPKDFILQMEGQLFIHKNKWITQGIEIFIDTVKTLPYQTAG